MSETSAARVPVLMYHRVDEAMAPNEHRYGVTAKQFAGHLDWLAAHRWEPCSVGDFDQWLAGVATLPERSVLITFDDGFAGLHRHALPLLAARGWPATVFLVSSLVGQRDVWTRREPEAGHELLNRVQVAEMSRHHVAFHSHSRRHADLTALCNSELIDEVAGSRAELQDWLGSAVNYFAYPFGRVDARVQAAVQEAGYRLAFGVAPGFNRQRSEPLAVRRLDITGKDSPARFGRKVLLGSNDGSIGYRLRYIGRRIAARIVA